MKKSKQYSIGVDYGTNSVRAVLVDLADGRECATSVFGYPGGKEGILLDARDPNLARQRPGDYVRGFDRTVSLILAEAGKRIRGLTAEALQKMQAYRWPGNVRELKNAIERAVVLTRTEWIEADDLVLSSLPIAHESGEIVRPHPPPTHRTLDEVEKWHIQTTLDAENWNKSRSAAILGIERSTLDRKIRRYDLKPPPPAREE